MPRRMGYAKNLWVCGFGASGRPRLELLKTLPDTREHVQYELNILALLGPVFMATKGYAAKEVEHTYTRARELCQLLGDAPQLFAVLFGLSRLYFVRAHHHMTLTLGQQCLALAQGQRDPEYLQSAHRIIGAAKSLLGELSDARTHLEQALELYDAQSRPSSGATQDPGVAYLSFLAWTLAPLGYLDQSLACIRRAVTRGKELSHPFSLVFAIGHTQMVHQWRREPQTLQRRAEEVKAMATEHGFPLFQAQGMLFQGWAIAMQGRAQEEVALLQQGLETYRATGQENFRPYFLALWAEAHGQDGQTEAGLALLDEALAVVDKNEERLWEAELYRLKGEFLLRQSSHNDDQAVSCFHYALDVSRSQQAKLWELRIATSLAKLWQNQGKRDEALELLAPVYGWFTEGFDTADLVGTKALLDELLESC
jgi:predicted ATPase